MIEIEDVIGRWCLGVFKNVLWDRKAHLVKIIDISSSKKYVKYEFPNSLLERKSIHNIEILRVI